MGPDFPIDAGMASREPGIRARFSGKIPQAPIGRRGRFFPKPKARPCTDARRLTFAWDNGEIGPVCRHIPSASLMTIEVLGNFLSLPAMVTFKDIQASEEIRTYIHQADLSLQALGYTEHNFTHAMKCARLAGQILSELEYDERSAELARIAAYMHDIGNVVNRVDHAQSGAVMAFRLLDKMGMPPQEIAAVVTAIGNHDEATAFPVNEIAAALIIADKSDVRRSRVRSAADINSDIHDRVNYAVTESDVLLDTSARTLTLNLAIDTEICAVMDYFEIFMSRMLLCRRAACRLDIAFKLRINGTMIL